jgi:ectoine hydroxylase-related dioxygenase (phytanoyl-CoA dioxygenase family)
MLTSEQLLRWERDGFFVLRGFADTAKGHAMAEETIAAIRADPPSAHSGEPAYVTREELLIQPEAKPVGGAVHPEDHVSKVFNTHLAGHARDFALQERCGAIVAELLEADVDVFQSMFILKNAGAWGQPWHQDSHYFNFDHQPQVGLWLAISEATLENGCLSVLPGSHRLPIQQHHPDKRPGANYGYLEIEGVDESTATPVLMRPGDLLVFHSYLLHKSVDNRSNARRAAMVYHYGRAGTKNLAPPDVAKRQEAVTRWVPVVRGWTRAA